MSLSEQNRATLERNVASAEARKALRVYETCLDGLLDAARAEGVADLLKDPKVVHINMLRGGIAKLTPAQIGHLYRGEEATEVIREVARQNPEAEGVAALQQATEPVAWRPEVRAFADLMEAQLRANDHKPGWKDDADLDLFERLGEESAELLAALHRNAKRLMWGDDWVMEDTVPRVGREAADVANFAMMIADVCGALESPLPQQTALVEQGVEKIIAPHEPAACGASAPSEPPRSDGDQQ